MWWGLWIGRKLDRICILGFIDSEPRIFCVDVLCLEPSGIVCSNILLSTFTNWTRLMENYNFHWSGHLEMEQRFFFFLFPSSTNSSARLGYCSMKCITMARLTLCLKLNFSAGLFCTRRQVFFFSNVESQMMELACCVKMEESLLNTSFCNDLLHNGGGRMYYLLLVGYQRHLWSYTKFLTSPGLDTVKFEFRVEKF